MQLLRVFVIVVVSVLWYSGQIDAERVDCACVQPRALWWNAPMPPYTSAYVIRAPYAVRMWTDDSWHSWVKRGVALMAQSDESIFVAVEHQRVFAPYENHTIADVSDFGHFCVCREDVEPRDVRETNADIMIARVEANLDDNKFHQRVLVFACVMLWALRALLHESTLTLYALTFVLTLFLSAGILWCIVFRRDFKEGAAVSLLTAALVTKCQTTWIGIDDEVAVFWVVGYVVFCACLASVIVAHHALSAIVRSSLDFLLLLGGVGCVMWVTKASGTLFLVTGATVCAMLFVIDSLFRDTNH